MYVCRCQCDTTPSCFAGGASTNKCLSRDGARLKYDNGNRIQQLVRLNIQAARCGEVTATNSCSRKSLLSTSEVVILSLPPSEEGKRWLLSLGCQCLSFFSFRKDCFQTSTCPTINQKIHHSFWVKFRNRIVHPRMKLFYKCYPMSNPLSHRN